MDKPSPLKPVERDEAMERDYIPIGGGWEIQTRGKGSTFRIFDGKHQHIVEGFGLDELMTRLAYAVRENIAAVERHARNAAIDLAAKSVTKRRDDYVQEHGNYDHETGMTEFPSGGDEWVAEWEEIAETILALKGRQ